MDPAFLLLPDPDAPAFPRLARKVRLIALRALLTHPAAGALGAARPVIAAAAKQYKAAVLAALACPDVLAPLLVLHAGLRAPEPLLDVAVPALLLQLVRRRALPESVVWSRPVSRLVDDGGDRVFRFDPPAPAVLFAPEGAEARLANGQLVPLLDKNPLPSGVVAEAAFTPLASGARLATVDTNPLSDVEAHPDKSGNAIDLGGRDAAAWRAGLDDAMRLVATGLPGWWAELPSALRRVVPVGYHDQQHLSASYREAPNLIYMTLHPNRVTLAEALIHEVQHGKLNTLLQLDPVLHNGRTAWTPSPVRPDLRPLEGVLLAVHAFVPVAALHCALAEQGHPLADDPWFRRRRAEVLAGNERGIEILEDMGDWTQTGRTLRDAIRCLHGDLMARAPAPPPELPTTRLDAALPG